MKASLGPLSGLFKKLAQLGVNESGSGLLTSSSPRSELLYDVIERMRKVFLETEQDEPELVG